VVWPGCWRYSDRQQVNLVDLNDLLNGLWSAAAHWADGSKWSVIIYESQLIERAAAANLETKSDNYMHLSYAALTDGTYVKYECE